MKKIILTIAVFLFIFIAPTAHAANYLLDGITCIGDGVSCTPCDLIRVLLNAADMIVALSGTFGIVMVVYGGFVLVTAYGNDSRVKWGKDTIIASIIGIIIVMMAWTLINVIMEGFFEASGAAFRQVTGRPHKEWNACQIDPTE